MFFPGGGEFLQAVITDLSLVESLGVTGELMKAIDLAVPLLLDLFSCLLERLGHFAGGFACCARLG